MWTCFKFSPMKNIFRKLWASDGLILACLQICRELLSLLTFLLVYSNSKEISYLLWQNTYPNLKTTCHIKLTFFLWTKLLENSLFATKYFISILAPLKKNYLAKIDYRINYSSLTDRKIRNKWYDLILNVWNKFEWKQSKIITNCI